MKKHVPVLLNETLKELSEINSSNLIVIDCTLGQAGHSWEIFSTMNKGVLLSIDLNKASIEWTAQNYGLELTDLNGKKVYLKVEGDKKWIVLEEDFQNIDKILSDLKLESYDLILADLGFSNFELNQNIGISFSKSDQDLNMNYSNSGIFAKDILNGFSPDELKIVFEKYFDQIGLKVIISRITNYRGKKSFKKISDLQDSLNNLPNTYLIKATQGLRSFVNQEEQKLRDFCEKSKKLISHYGKSLVITFNPLEEEIVNSVFEDHQIVEPNIDEIIKNPQSRSAKLHIYKKTTNTSTLKEKQY